MWDGAQYVVDFGCPNTTNIDEMLDDVGLNISAGVRASHWFKPVSTAAYRDVARTLVARLDPPDEPASIKIPVKVGASG